MSYRCGFVGLIGLPNAGKSTLLNSLVEEKVSIVSEKPQTTRRRILGIISNPKSQVVFVDAPGVLHATKGLNAFLASEAREVIDQSDVLAAVLNPDAKSKEEIEKIISLVEEGKKPWLVIISKVDKVELHSRVEAIRDMVKGRKRFLGVVEFSSQWGKKEKSWSDSLLSLVLPELPEAPQPMYDMELYTPHTLRELAAEIVREKCFDYLEREVPYGLAVKVEQFDESNPKLTKIYIGLVAAKESFKPIIVGKAGAKIKKIGMEARKELEKLIGHQVFLKLEVVVKENWFENRNIMKELGYVSEKRKQ